MKEKVTFYEQQIEKLDGILATLKKKLLQSSFFRFLVFISTVGGVYFFYANTATAISVFVLGASCFIYLVSRHADLQYKRDKILMLLKINRTELDVLDRNFHSLPEGDQFVDTNHPFSHDIDLFGKGSFYQYSNRTSIPEGSKVLASLLLANDISNISQKQEAIKELRDLPEWRQEFSASALLVKTELSSEKLVMWLQKYTAFVPQLMKWLPTVFTVITGVLFALYFLDLLSGWGLVAWFFVGLGITGNYLKKINKLSADTSKVQDTFEQYQKLLVQLEEHHFDAVLLKELKSRILEKDKKVSAVLKGFAGILNALDQRNNMLFGIFGNGFLLWDLRQCFLLEQWINAYGHHVEKWFNTIALFDAYNSMGNFAFNHPQYTFPKLSSGTTIVNAMGVSHPMLDPAMAVHNNFEISKEEFFIITGANMAGKSTFLRTVSLLLVMANMGMPVCANEVAYAPIKLITSMRSSDSLAKDESYFFSELKRLKYIVDKMAEDPYFIVLDEILKGTNSTDKAIGSQKFIEKLVASKSTGIIATHDLSLCEVAKKYPQVVNYFFDAQIVNDTLHFDYTFKKGVCQNMNASFLLSNMGIV
ncbi:MAG: DNA mismatch repair protein MutS [Muriicola sp.]|nr:DNA mismatch repair protein MutS [Muriicola sp.]